MLDFAAILAASSSAYLVLDRSLLICWANPAYLRATMQRLDAIVGRNVFDVFPEPQGDNSVRASFQRVIRDGVSDTLPVQRYPIPQPDGSMAVRWWSPVNSPIRNKAGEIVGVLHRVEDVTALEPDSPRLAYELFARGRELAEANARLEQARQELEQFSAFCAHDLRAPLRHARQAIADGRSQDGYAAIVRAESLIADLLALARVGREALRPELVDMGALVRGAAWDAMALEDERSIEIAVGDLPAATCDASLMTLAIQNLVGNAIKFTRCRPYAFVAVSFEDGAYCIRDNGRGFPPEQAARIFEAFTRLDPNVPGTGVGLAIVAKVIQKHGGRCWAESEPGVGATFRFSLS